MLYKRESERLDQHEARVRNRDAEQPAKMDATLTALAALAALRESML